MKRFFAIIMVFVLGGLYAADEVTTTSFITITKGGRELTFDSAILDQSITYQHMSEDVQMDAADQASWVEQVLEDLSVEQAQALLHALGLQDENILRDYLDSLSPDKLIVMVQMGGYLDVQLLYDQAVKAVAQKIRNKVINGNTLGIKQLGLYLTDIAQEHYLLIGRRISQVPQWLRNFWVIGASELNQAQRITNEDERRAFLASLDGEILIGVIQRFRQLQAEGKLDDSVLYGQIIDVIAQKIMDKEITGVKAKQLEPFLNDIAKTYSFIAFKKLPYSNRMRFPSIDKFVPSWLVKHLSFSIQELIDRNMLPVIRSERWSSGSLQSLDLENRYLSSLEGLQNIPGIENVQWLNLRNNQLTALPESIGNLTSLRDLFLNNNQLTALPESIGNLTSLRDLFLNNNQLVALPERIGNLISLQYLDLNNNQLAALPESIGNLVSLQRLFLNNNQLVALPERIGDLISLQYLNLNNNQLAALPESIGGLASLRELWLDNNQLAALPESIGNLVSLQWLHLSDNQLTALPRSIGNQALLQELELYNIGVLPFFPEGVGNNLASLQYLGLRNNRLSPQEVDAIRNILKKSRIAFGNQNPPVEEVTSIVSPQAASSSTTSSSMTALPSPEQMQAHERGQKRKRGSDEESEDQDQDEELDRDGKRQKNKKEGTENEE